MKGNQQLLADLLNPVQQAGAPAMDIFGMGGGGVSRMDQLMLDHGMFAPQAPQAPPMPFIDEWDGGQWTPQRDLSHQGFDTDQRGYYPLADRPYLYQDSPDIHVREGGFRQDAGISSEHMGRLPPVDPRYSPPIVPLLPPWGIIGPDPNNPPIGPVNPTIRPPRPSGEIDNPSGQQVASLSPFDISPADVWAQRDLHQSPGSMGEIDRWGHGYDQSVVPQSFHDLGNNWQQTTPQQVFQDLRQQGSGMEMFPPDMFSPGHDPYSVMGQFNDPFAGQTPGGAGGFGMFGPSQPPSDTFADRFHFDSPSNEPDEPGPTAQDLAAARDSVNSRGNSSAGTSHIWPGLTNAARPPNLQWQSGVGPGGLQQAPGVWGGMSNTTIGPGGLPMINYI